MAHTDGTLRIPSQSSGVSTFKPEQDLLTPIPRHIPGPMYEQVKQRLYEYIRRGHVGLGKQLPPVRELCGQFNVSHQTVNKALDEIEAAGIIYRIQGKGTFVRSIPRIEAQFSQLRGLTQTLETAGLRTHADILGVREIARSDELDAFFRSPPDRQSSYTEITRLRYANEIPVVLNRSTVTRKMAEWMLARSLETASYYQLFGEYTHLPVSREDHIITLCNVKEDDAEALQIRPGTTHFLVESQVFVDEDTPVEQSCSIFHRDYFRFHVRSISFVPGEMSASR